MRVIEVSESELPLRCPPPRAANWHLHPRVFLPLSRTRPEIQCPYCGARYALRPAAKGKAL